jgi:23S rRNA (cytidine1920-2'-O)/16S rRNA (cytidine1409-2'-O)-methyltransferase
MRSPVKEVKTRIDVAMVARGMAESRNQAQAIIMAGDVLVNGEPARHASNTIRAADLIELKAKPRFVSRGGEKLAEAIDAFGLDANGAVCVDLGASTGGFTDCLLQTGAAKVYAIDVGHGQLDDRLRRDDRVVVMERLNARYLEALPEPVGVAVIDVSFISLKLILPVAQTLLVENGVCVPLIKPQFEAGKGQVGKGGVVREPEIHRSVLRDVLTFAATHGFEVRGLIASPILGPAGNREFLAHLVKSVEPGLNIGELIAKVVPGT